MSIRLILLLSVLHMARSRVHFEGDEPFVWTKLGGLRGVYQNYSGIRVAAFLGVPFAQPPIGHLRFEKPQMVQNWWNGYCPPADSSVAKSDCVGEKLDVSSNEPGQQIPSCEGYVRDANKPANSCMLTPDQYFPGFRGSEMWNPPNTSNISEDCLYLNMWVPENPSGEVLVWIFGGGFFSGSPSLDLYNGKVLAANHSLIVVNINYRLGPFGFFYLAGNSNVTGNMGLLDQQMALKWIHENIKQFGGDSEKVTLFGESAGSASVTAHLLANGSHSYFTKIICLSGSLTNLWSTRAPGTMNNVSMELARNLSCPDKKESEDVLDCLKKKNAIEIQSAADNAFLNEPAMSFPFAPINEDTVFFNGNIFEHLKNKKFKKDVSAIFGTVNDEGTFWLPYYLYESGFAFNSSLSAEAEENQALINEQQYNDSMAAFISYFSGSDDKKEELISGYKGLFSYRSQIGEKLRDGVGRFLGDLFFTCNLTSFADIIADETNVYMYYFNMSSSANPWPKWMGVMHGYEIEYMFGQPFSHPSLYNQTQLGTEQEFSMQVMDMWSRFIKNGRPSDEWKPYTSSDRQVLVLNRSLTSTHKSEHVDLHGEQCTLIKNAVPVSGLPNITNDEHA